MGVAIPGIQRFAAGELLVPSSHRYAAEPGDVDRSLLGCLVEVDKQKWAPLKLTTSIEGGFRSGIEGVHFVWAPSTSAVRTVWKKSGHPFCVGYDLSAWSGFKTGEKAIDAGVLEELHRLWDEESSGNLDMLKALYGDEYAIPDYDLNDGASQAARV